MRSRDRHTDPTTFSRGSSGLKEMTEITPTKAIPRQRAATDSHDQGTIASVMQPDSGRPEGSPGPESDSSASDPVQTAARLDPSCVDPSGAADEVEYAVGQAAPGSDLDWEALTPRGLYAAYGKRAFTFVLLLVVLPLALLIALPIALVNWIQFGQLGRVLYCQPRVGQRGKTFSIFKFRTMREAPQDAYDSWSQGQDRLRVTTFGRLLRNTHLDELPQLLNILRGEMDFIGPRPEMVEIDRWACTHVPGFRKRNALLPGITGYAQITQGYAGKDAAAYAQKLAGDEHYRERLSLTQDVLILLRTGLWMIRGRGWRFAPARTSSGRGSKPSAGGHPKTQHFSGDSDLCHEEEKSTDGMSGTSAA